ncbi:MAG: hypothetical protein M3Y81_29660, partial [Chloroflexota bacterium]|nr:hypothetical protein [Chloroflexota bacterium]
GITITPATRACKRRPYATAPLRDGDNPRPMKIPRGLCEQTHIPLETRLLLLHDYVGYTVGRR